MARCKVCFRHCEIPEGKTGFCGARACENGAVFPTLVDEVQRALGRILSSEDLIKLFGIYDSLGLYVRLTCMNSQMDLENLLANGKIDIAPSDMFRTIMWQNKRKNIRFH